MSLEIEGSGKAVLGIGHLSKGLKEVEKGDGHTCGGRGNIECKGTETRACSPGAARRPAWLEQSE